MDLDLTVDDPCLEKKDFCVNCNSHFMTVRPSVKSMAISKRFMKDLRNQEEAASIIKDVLDCSHLEFHELHKFERNIDGNLVFRAKRGQIHIIYAVDKRMRILFLRAVKNFPEYKKLLRNRREILRMITRLQ
ncbi:MAG: hypothetical protein JSV85_06300 [Candidatus Bathyarchaeota archaeon]|nr:MAG: hypothetical protein JSV85_06300 [Candidatus Bathyarchaeota archaeon]